MLGSSGPLKQKHRLNSVLAWEVTLDPLHALPCSRCKPSLLGCSHTGTQCKLFFFFCTYSASTRGETVWKHCFFSHFHPHLPLFSSLVQVLLSGVKHSNLPVGAEAAICLIQLSPFSFSCQITEHLSFKPVRRGKEKKIWRGSIIAWLLIRRMSCIITIVFNNTTVK